MKIKIDKLDILFSKIVRLLADGKCEYCGKKTRLECSHFHGRRKRSVRWDLENAAGVCFSCHLYLGENPYAHTEWFKKRLGTDKFEKLNIRAEQIVKVDKEAIEVDLRNKLKILGGDNGS